MMFSVFVNSSMILSDSTDAGGASSVEIYLPLK